MSADLPTVAALAVTLSDGELAQLIEIAEDALAQRTGRPRRLIGASLLAEALGCSERHARRLLSGETPGLRPRVIVDGPTPVAAITEQDAGLYRPASARGHPRRGR